MTRAHPFTKPNADIVLRSSDGINFRVHKLILSEASPVFEGMFALPQPAASSRDSESNTAHADCDGLPVVAVTEKGKTLENLLRICYPMADPVLDAVEEVEEVLKAAQKYEIEAAVTLMRKRLVDPFFLDTEEGVYTVYAAAWCLNLEQEAAIAARCTLRWDLPFSLSDPLEAIPPQALFRLLEYRIRCVGAALEFVWHPERWKILQKPSESMDDDSLPPYMDHYLMRSKLGDFMFYRCKTCVKWSYGYDGYDNTGELRVAQKEFQEEIAAALQQRPHGISIKESTFLGEQLLESTGCQSCKMAGLTSLQDLYERLGRDLDEIVSEVSQIVSYQA